MMLSNGKVAKYPIKKPTDNEIRKALECCSTHDGCKSCIFFEDCKSPIVQAELIMKNALDLINRQKAEIERLEKEKCNSLTFNLIPARGSGKTSVLKIKIDEIKAEAYKEFAERLKERTKGCYYLSATNDIDNLLKEMVGADDERKN